MEKALIRRDLEPGEERQALYLIQWMARKREIQFEPASPADPPGNMAITMPVRRMVLLGFTAGISAIAVTLLLLIYDSGLWTIPALIGIAGLGYLVRIKLWRPQKTNQAPYQ